MAILGPNIARDLALQIPGLTIDASGEITDIQGDPVLITEDLFNGYKGLSSQVSQLILYNLLETFPDVRAEYTQPLTKIKLVCSLANKNAA